MGTTLSRLKEIIQQKGAGFVLLLDPDKSSLPQLPDTIHQAIEAGVDVFFLGGSFLFQNNFDTFVQTVKQAAGDHPVILFPGSIYQLSAHADAVLYLSLISSRNPEHLIGTQVLAAPLVWKLGLETISCGYMIIESGKLTSAQFLSNSSPIPRNKPDIALAHALAAQYLGMQTVYLESGSGAELTVPEEMIQQIAQHIRIPLIVGGGIRSPETAAAKVQAGAQLVVVGNFFEKSDHIHLMREFASAIHQK
ncbi:MAG: geranylgeranylglyceryl/heptaprenylglyceryl phosphate synthase [Calditrichaeota bacterium]|nr:geranylgeranylglyceryl/heptaprenylglyceryl phosphate synthase [Calditrichota bacterium]